MINQLKQKRQFKKILVIDDSIDLLELQELFLTANYYQVFKAPSGNTALKVLETLKEPNLILLDMNIGDMTGIEFLEKLKIKYPLVAHHTPIAFLSGVETVPPSIAKIFIRKPIHLDNFLITIDNLIEKYPTKY